MFTYTLHAGIEGTWNITSPTLEQSSRWWRAVSLTPCRFTLEKSAACTYCTAGWVGLGIGVDFFRTDKYLAPAGGCKLS